MFQTAQRAHAWLKEQGYPVVEPLVFSDPPLPKGAAEHIDEWALLAKLDDGAGLPVHLYWLRAVPQANLNDLKYVAQVYHSKYPTVHLLLVARYQRYHRWEYVLVCPNQSAPRNQWGRALHADLDTETDASSLLRYDPTVPVEKYWQRIYATLRGEPMNERVKQALESCIAELESILSEIKMSIKCAVDEEDTDRIDELNREVKSVKRVIEQVQQIAASAPTPSTPIRTAKSPVRSRQRGKRQPRGTPEEAYRVPILEALVELGGKAPVSAVLERVYTKLEGRLQPSDLEFVPSGQEERWRNTAKWARADLKEQGYLAADSPKGIWEITDAGRRYLESLKREQGVQ
jgi:restriction system protein